MNSRATLPTDARLSRLTGEPVAWLVMAAVILLAPATTCAAAAEDEASRRERHATVAAAVEYLRTRQNDDGSFGTVQPNLQTGLAVLALLSVPAEPSAADREQIADAVAYLVRVGGRRGDLGDTQFSTESHAVASAALLLALPCIEDEEAYAAASETAHRALRHLLRLQDRSSAGGSRGGWKLEGTQGRENDRRASTWALLVLDAARRLLIEIDEAAIERGGRYVLAAYKKQADNPDEIGGLSVETDGLTVASVSAMGGYLLTHVVPDSKAADLNGAWLVRHPPAWSGPNYFYTAFFHIRAMRSGSAEDYHRGLRRLTLQLREHQLADGSVGIPPGNAQNTFAMGPTFSTAMAILIANVEDSHLVFDRNHDVRLELEPRMDTAETEIP